MVDLEVGLRANLCAVCW